MKGPGLVFIIPFVQEIVRIHVIEVPAQDVISRDNVSKSMQSFISM
ncbi:MAG: hypothetical protein ACYCQM_12055 [Acidithiobacillus sp.]